MASLRPKYIAAMRAFFASKGQSLAPDANSTLRVAYGTVIGQKKGAAQGLPDIRSHGTLGSPEKGNGDGSL